VTVGLVAADLLAAGAGDVLDQVVVVVVEAQSGFVDFDGDDLTGIAQPEHWVWQLQVSRGQPG
jgi:hypothetical protein